MSAVQSSGGAMAAAEMSVEVDFSVSGSRGRFLLHVRSADKAAALFPREWWIGIKERRRLGFLVATRRR